MESCLGRPQRKRTVNTACLPSAPFKGGIKFVPYKTYALKLSNILLFLYYLPYFIKNLPPCPTSYSRDGHSTWLIVMVFRKGLFADIVCRLVSFIDTLILPVKSPSVATHILQPLLHKQHLAGLMVPSEFLGAPTGTASLPYQVLPRTTTIITHPIQIQGIVEQTSRFPKQTIIPLF